MSLRGRSCFAARTFSRRTKLFFWLFVTCFVLCGSFTAVFLVAGVRRFNIGKTIDEASRGKDGVALLGHAYNIDIAARQVQISWLVLGCGSLALFVGSYGSNKCGRPNIAVDFYVDGATNASGSYDPTTNLWYETRTGNEFYIQASVEIQTEHLLEVTAWYGQDQQYAYPFDTYILDTFIQALTPDGNVSVPILFLRTADATNNFQPSLNKDEDVRTLSIDGSPITRAHAVQYAFHRPALSQLFVMVLFTLNWLLTAVVAYIAVSAYEGVPMSEGVLILPLSVILTIPALRALWVDAPAFGLLLDSCGTFLQMVIVSLASLYLVVNVGLRRPKAAQQEQQQENIIAQSQAQGQAQALSDRDLEKDGANLGLTVPLLEQHSQSRPRRTSDTGADP
ncbi:hypothetical protein C8Q74DRAFT_1367625 [Fomes fomentarius]|nr:hypothetical protein C8Q74DRAFT_1367625 [Fomes fomentarius]